MADNTTKIILTAEDRASAVLNQAQKSLQSLSSSMLNMPSLAAGFSTAAIATGLIALTKSGIDYMASLHDMSIATGATVESLSAMKTAAKLANTDMESVGQSVKKLSISLGEARLKGGAKADMLAALGIDPKSVTDSGQALFDLAQKLDGMTDKTKALAIARELLGKGANMTFLNELAAQGSLIAKVTAEQAAAADQFNDNMTRLKNGAGALGIALANGALPPLNDILNFSLEIKKEWGTIAGIIFGLGGGAILKGLGVELDPLKRAAKETTEALNGLIEARRKLAEETAVRANVDGQLGPLGKWLRDQRVDSSGGDVKAASARLRASLANEAALQKDKTEQDYAEYRRKKNLGASIPDGALAAAKTPRDEFTPLMRAIGERNAELGMELQSTEKLTESQKFALKVMADLQGGYLKLTDAEKVLLAQRLEGMLASDQVLQQWKDFDEQTKEYMKHRQELLAVDQAIADIDQSFGRQNTDKRSDMTVMPEAQRNLIKALNQVDEAGRKTSDGLRKNLSDGKISAEEYAEKMALLNDVLSAQKVRVSELSDEQLNLNASWEYGASNSLQKYVDTVSNVAASTEAMMTHAFGGMEDALVDFVKTGKLDFRSLADSIISDLIRMQVQQSIMEPLGKAFKGSNLFDGLSNLFGGSGGVPSTSSYIANDWLGPFATGTNYVPNDGFAFLHKGEAVVPAEFNNGGGGGGSGIIINQSLNFATGVSQTVRAEVLNLLPQIQAASVAAMADARQRGGSARMAFKG